MHSKKLEHFCRVCCNTNNLKPLNGVEMGWFSISDKNAKICQFCRSTASTLYEEAKIFSDCFENFKIEGML